MTDYLESEYGFITEQIGAKLTGKELYLETQFNELLQIIDLHLLYWNRTQANSSITNLHQERQIIINFLDCLQCVLILPINYSAHKMIELKRPCRCFMI
jgi:hypothetical protein